MPHSTAAYGTGEVDAFNRDSPLFVGYNVLLDAVDARWTLTGTQAGTDVTLSANPARRAWDGRGSRGTQFVGSATTLYFNVQIPASVIDTLAIIFPENYASGSVLVQIADDAAFTSNVTTFAGPFAAQTGCRIVRSFDDGDRYQGVEYIRVRFVRDGGATYNTTTAPSIGELYVGRGRIFSLWWAHGDDAVPTRSRSVDYDAPSGDRTRYQHHYGRHVARHSQSISSNSTEVLNDPATARLVSDDSVFFTKPILYLPRPVSLASKAMLGFGPEDGLDMPQSNYFEYDFQTSFVEQPPFFALDCSSVVASFTSEYSYLFDGAGTDAINMGDVAQFDGATQVTWAWWQHTDEVTWQTRGIISKYSAGQQCYSIRAENPRRIQVNISTSLSTGATGVIPNNTFTNGIWEHVVVVYDGTGPDNPGRLQIYVNGSSRAITFSGTIPAAMTSGSSSNFVFGGIGNANSPWNGNMDEVAVWIGTAASSSQASELYNSGAEWDVSTSTLGAPTFWYRADGDSPPTAVDYGTAGVNGTYVSDATRELFVP